MSILNVPNLGVLAANIVFYPRSKINLTSLPSLPFAFVQERIACVDFDFFFLLKEVEFVICKRIFSKFE